jgi:uncharacterized OB-fold protein
MSAKFADWTSGEAAIRYQSCAACGRVQYFRRGFCAACGATELAEQRASGEGTVYATSLVCRSATPETRTHVPYNILLVDTAEGFRMMAMATTISPSPIASRCGSSHSPDGWCHILKGGMSRKVVASQRVA